MATYDKSTIARLWSKIDRRGPDECWEWQGAAGTSAHGRIKVCGRLLAPHRVVYETEIGPLAPSTGYHGTVIRHSCDNPRCCNPAHLVPGTQRENVRDMYERRRGHSDSRITPELRRKIATSSLPVTAAAEIFGVDKKTVRRIRQAALA